MLHVASKAVLLLLATGLFYRRHRPNRNMTLMIATSFMV